MSIGERFEIVLESSRTRLTQSRREQLLMAMQEFVESPECEAITPDEIIFMLAGGLLTQMAAYEEIAKAQIGAEILKKALG